MTGQQRKVIINAAVAILIAAAAFGVWKTWFSSSPTEQIDRLLGRAADYAQNESLIRFSGLLDENFNANGAGKAAVVHELQRFFAQSDELSVSIERTVHEDPELAPNAKRARAITVVVVEGIETAGRQRFRGLGEGGADAFLVDFIQREGNWRIAGASHLDASSPETLMEYLKQ